MSILLYQQNDEYYLINQTNKKNMNNIPIKVMKNIKLRSNDDSPDSFEDVFNVCRIVHKIDYNTVYLQLDELLSHSAIQWAVNTGHFSLFKYLCDNYTESYVNKYILTEVCMWNDLVMLEYLCSKGVDIHADNDYALYVAARSGYFEMVQYLWEQGCRVNVKDPDVEPVLEDLDVQKFLEDPWGTWAIQDNTWLDDHDIDETDPHPSDRYDDYRNALNVAAQRGYVEIVRFFLKNNVLLTLSKNERDALHPNVTDEINNYDNKICRIKRA